MITWKLFKGSVSKELFKKFEFAEDTVPEHIHSTFKHIGVSSSIDQELRINRWHTRS